MFDDKIDHPAEYEKMMEGIKGVKQLENIDVTLIS